MGACRRSSSVYGCNRLVVTFKLLAARLILAGVFLISAIPKLASPRRFAEDVQQYRMLPRPLASAFVLCGAAILAYLSLRMSRRPAAHEPTSSPSLPMR